MPIIATERIAKTVEAAVYVTIIREVVEERHLFRRKRQIPKLFIRVVDEGSEIEHKPGYVHTISYTVKLNLSLQILFRTISEG